MTDAVLRAKREAVRIQRRNVVQLEHELSRAREELLELEGDLKTAEEGKGGDPNPAPVDDGDIHHG